MPSSNVYVCEYVYGRRKKALSFASKNILTTYKIHKRIYSR